ncbi:hypothetical protein NKR23_g1559 [Pleurostoma richardsiae]|uniref:Uncharacterized protein n=1 Tax=Pleurostoma richardsiae TaxID=41990 RepID=A0AA38VW03_9PEZI|nr:hypothetical protein NKR23_g1559 [Pleurostoma richardsiae]
MTRLPSESFVPPGVVDSGLHTSFPGDSGDSSSSVISPLSLPRGALHYFDDQQPSARSHLHPNSSSARNYAYPPSSSNSRGPPQAEPAYFLSPNLAPVSTQVGYQLQFRRQQRSASLSPTRKANGGRSSVMNRARPAMVSPPRAPAASTMLSFGSIPGSVAGSISATSGVSSSTAGGSVVHPRSVSAEPTAMASQEDKIRRLEEQNARIKSAWEAERKQLQQSRDIAEEVYHGERKIMEEDRKKWALEREMFETEIQRLRERLALAEAGIPTKGMAALRNANVPRAHMPGGWDVSPESMRGSDSSQGSSQGIGPGRTTSLQPGAEPVFGGQASGRVGPSMQPDLPPFMHLGQHLSLAAGSTMHTMATVEEKDETPVPTVDIHEVHPALEGIRLRATAIQRSTFTDKASPSGSRSSSGKSSPSDDASNAKVQPGRVTTLKVLAADENIRLTMHAGHTPSHSLSVVPSITGTAAGTTASSSGSCTPTLGGIDGADDTVVLSGGDAVDEVSIRPEEPPEPRATAAPESEDQFDHPEAMLDAFEDRELTGPLTLRNHPAKDEAFLRRLSDKLEKVNSGEDSVPTVLKSSPVESELLRTEGGTGLVDAGPHHGGDAANDSSDKSDAEEEDIPLKLKRSNNFGAPLGSFR